MLIAQISDTHILAKESVLAASASRAQNLRQCIDDINRQRPDVVIHTGDSVQDGKPEEYAHLREILEALDAPYYPVQGNRDRQAALCDALDHLSFLPRAGNFLQYVVEDYPLRLVGLDSVVAGERKGVFSQDRQAWLEQTLSEQPDRPTLLFMHHPPFDIDPHYVGGYRRGQEAQSLTQLIKRHSQVVRLLCGHVHCPHREEPWGGTVATTMPSVAVDLRKGVDPEYGDAPLYMLHRLSADGSLDSQLCKAGSA